MNPLYHINKSIFKTIWKFNRLFFAKELPIKIAVAFHQLERHHYEAFILFVNYFRNLGYSFCSPDNFIKEDRIKKIFVSFDDNYYSWFSALDLFDFLDLKCTFYINTLPVRDLTSNEKIEEYFSLFKYKGERKSLSSQEIREIGKRGHIVGSHTHSHVNLTSLPETSAKYDIQFGKQSLEDITGEEVKHFSYPYGMRRYFNEKLRRYCLEIGFQTIANAIPAMQYVHQMPSNINRSPWVLDMPLDYNVANIKIDGHFFEHLTGRSAVG